MGRVLDCADVMPRARCRTYQLLIEVPRAIHLVVGRLGAFDLLPGCYIYTGSAKRNLQARVRRHLGEHKRLHWHIDYLLSIPGVRVNGVSYFKTAECTINRATRGHIVIRQFGAGDCHAGCGSHLKYLGPSDGRVIPESSLPLASSHPVRGRLEL